MCHHRKGEEKQIEKLTSLLSRWRLEVMYILLMISIVTSEVLGAFKSLEFRSSYVGNTNVDIVWTNLIISIANKDALDAIYLVLETIVTTKKDLFHWSFSPPASAFSINSRNTKSA